MAITSEGAIPSESNYNRTEELKAFDQTKTGVKGLVDSGIQKIPKIFIRPADELNQISNPKPTHFQIPVIDLQGERKNMIQDIKTASEKYGFFQIVNHGVPISVLDEMIKGVTRFFEQEDEIKKPYYTRDRSRRVRYNSNYDLYISKAANWRDSLGANLLRSDPLDPNELPATCRDITLEYTNHVTNLGDTLLEFFSEALGLNTEHLKKMNYAEAFGYVCHYYPACPEPELTLGTASHRDASFITVLLQDDIGGLQILHQDHWVDVRPLRGALVVNIGDLLQMVSNDKLKSIEHRVVASHVGPRISIACFMTALFDADTKSYGPIEELLSEDDGPVYREFTNKEYVEHFYHHGLDGKSGLDYFKL